MDGLMKQEYKKFYKNTNENRNQKRQAVQERKRMEYRKKRLITIGILGISFLIVLLAIIFSFRYFYKQIKEQEATTEAPVEVEPIVGAASLFPDLPISEEFLTVNKYSRPGLALSSTPQYIVIHYTANPSSTARQNRNYFENLKDTGETFASAQFVIG